jgi:hypothetical protein
MCQPLPDPTCSTAASTHAGACPARRSQQPRRRFLALRRIALCAVLLVMPLLRAAPSHAEDTISDLPVIDLSQLIINVLPPDGMDKLGWDYLLEAPYLSWQTFTTEKVGKATQRTAYARVRAGGQTTQVLHGVWRELMWSVTLGTFGNDRAGPRWIEIKPGGIGDENTCFGSQFRGCKFLSEQIFTARALHGTAVCSKHMGDTEAYLVSAPGKKPSLLVYYSWSSKDNESAWIEIHPVSDRAKICKGT